MFKFFKNKKISSNLLDTVDNYIKIKNNNSNKTYVLIKFAKKDRSIKYLIAELKGDVVQINDVYYYVNEDMLFYWDYIKNNKEKYKITQVDLYEDITVGFNPFSNIYSDIFKEKIQKAIYLQLQTGILENKLKKKLSTKQIILAILLGIGALFIIVKMFVK